MKLNCLLTVKYYVFVIFLLSNISFFFCQTSPKPTGEMLRYQQEIDDWHAQRIVSLTRADGWLSLAGLFWLKEGKNSFGSASDNDIRFPAGVTPEHMGIFTLQQGKVSVQIYPGVAVYHGSDPIKDLTLQEDTKSNPTILTHGTLSWYVVKRGDRSGIRLKDSAHPNLRNFQGIDRFPVVPRWKLIATFEPYPSPKIITIHDVTGAVSEETSPGALLFSIDHKSYRLDPIAKPEDRRWFIIFSDETSGEETYGAGRYLYVDAPGPEGTTVVDFNKAYNPPCAFTPYATCPLPPEQNHLAVKITAGEKTYQGYSH